MKFLTLFILVVLISFVACKTVPLQRVSISADKKAQLRGYTKRQSNIPLQGGIVSEALFYASLQLGSPGQTLNVQVDTGSSDLLVFGAQCSNCGSGATYQYTSSSTYAVVPCNQAGFTCATCVQFNGDDACSFSDYYGDGSGVNGSVLTDMLTVGSYSNIKVAFGDIQSSTQGFEPYPVDGIWGISYPDLAITKPAIYDLFSQAGVYQGYGLCLGTNPSMTFGQPSATYQFSPVVTAQPQYFNVQMNDLQVGGVSLGQINYEPAIVDSGTTLMVIPTTAFNALYQAMLNLCNSGSNLAGVCGVSQSQSVFGGQCTSSISSYPSLTVVLNPSLNLDVPPSSYFYENNGEYCLGIAASSQTILGDIFMQNFNVFFDIQNSQIGFANPSTCP